MDMGVLSHVGYGINALSFVLRDIVLLRIGAICASSCLIISAMSVHERWHATAMWHSLFICIHATNLSITFFGNRAARFTEEESELYAAPADPRTANVFDPAIRGKTDQFALRFRKPG